MNFYIKGKVVFLPVEVKNREWKSTLFLTHYFLKKGYHVVTGMLWHMNDYANNNSKNCVYVGKDFFKYEASVYSELKRNGHFIAAYDAEGLIYDNDNNYFSQSLNKETLNEVDCVIAWGKRQQVSILKFLNNEKQIFSLGNSRLDLLRKDFLINCYNQECKYILEHYGKDFILINSNFNVITREDYNAKETSVAVNGNQEENNVFFDKYNIFISELFPKFLQMIKTISFAFPDRIIILRPHPAENENTWMKLLKELKNVRIEKKFSVNPWINYAKVVIHSGCTTGIEATLMGKNVLSYQPSLTVKYPDTFPDRISKIITNEEKMIETISNIYRFNNSSTILNQKQKELLNYYFSINEDVTCSERIVNCIDKEYKKIAKLKFSTSISKRIDRYCNKKNEVNFNIEFGHIQFDECIHDFSEIYNSQPFSYKYKIYDLSDNKFLFYNKTVGGKRIEKKGFCKNCITDFFTLFKLFKSLLKRKVKLLFNSMK